MVKYRLNSLEISGTIRGELSAGGSGDSSPPSTVSITLDPFRYALFFGNRRRELDYGITGVPRLDAAPTQDGYAANTVGKFFFKIGKKKFKKKFFKKFFLLNLAEFFN